MIRPSYFAFNWETASDNEFQQIKVKKDFTREAQSEFDCLAEGLERLGVGFEIHENTENQLPDEVFLNNWFNTSPDGTLSLFPMKSPIRRKERRQDLLDNLIRNYRVNRILDYTSREEQNEFLEGTGSIIPDYKNGVAFLSESERSNVKLFSEWAKEMNLNPISFSAKSLNGKNIYHTNVLMHVGSEWAVICLDSIENPIERKMVQNQLEGLHKKVISISYRQLNEFCGNIFEVQGKGGAVICMSERAFNAFEKEQIRVLESFGSILKSPIPTIEKVGGGGVRCMMAGNYLPLKH